MAELFSNNFCMSALEALKCIKCDVLIKPKEVVEQLSGGVLKCEHHKIAAHALKRVLEQRGKDLHQDLGRGDREQLRVDLDLIIQIVKASKLNFTRITIRRDRVAKYLEEGRI